MTRDSMTNPSQNTCRPPGARTFPSSPALLVGAVLGTAMVAAPASAVVIDTFDTDQFFSYSQPVSPIPGGVTNTAGPDGSNIAGAYRDVTARITSSAGAGLKQVQIIAGAFNDSLFQQATTDPVYGLTTLIWDGSSTVSGNTANAPGAAPAAFALGLDLTNGDQHDRIRLDARADLSAGKFIVTVYKNATDFATRTLNVIGSGGNFLTYDFVYNAFTLSGGFTSADFANAQAIKLEIDYTAANAPSAAGLDVSIDLLETTNQVPETSLAPVLLLGSLIPLARRRRSSPAFA